MTRTSRKSLALLASLGAALAFVACGGGEEEQAAAPAAAQEAEPAAGEYTVAPVTDGGTLSGRISYEGKVPARKKLEVTKDLNVCGKEPILSEDLVVGDGKGLRNVVVQIEGIASGKEWSNGVLDQLNCQFNPHVKVVSPLDKTLTVQNSDGILHNFHTWPDKNEPLNKAQPGYQKTMEVSFEQPEVIKATCDVHSWMKAWIVVPPNPYVGVTGQDGGYSIEEVPPGTYQVTMWHETLGTQKSEVTIEAGQTATLDLTLADELSALARELASRAAAAGFVAFGIAPARDTGQGERLRRWLERGYHGEMGYMAERAERRVDPRGWAPWARTVVLVADAYFSAEPLPVEPARGAIARYARGADYHRVLKKRLRRLARTIPERVPDARAVPFVDTSPVLEKPLAERAGIGWQGKHTNVILDKRGSWVLLGGIATDLALPAAAPARDHCGSCTACIEVCPTRAIVAPYVLDARRCISYLTIELRGPIPVEFRKAIGNRIFGCDDCMEVCPWNRHAVAARDARYRPRPGLVAPRLVDLLRLSRGEFDALFRGSPVRRARYGGFLRNVAVALGNSGDADAVPALVEALGHDEPLARGHAAWALGELGGATAREALARRREMETDPEVRDEIARALRAGAAPDGARRSTG